VSRKQAILLAGRVSNQLLRDMPANQIDSHENHSFAPSGLIK